MDLFSLTAKEWQRQRDTLNLIASENYPSPKVLSLQGSVWQNKYAEGYPGKRYYAGNVYADALESLVQAKALEVFDKTGEYRANAQVLSGSPANAIVYLAMLRPGDTIMSLDLASGGHLSHLHATSSYLKFFNHVNYGLKSTPEGFVIDVDDLAEKLARLKPQLVIFGFSAYPRAYEFGPLIKLAHQHDALVLADIAHINGLVAAGLHDSPFKAGDSGADFVSMTTHKTLRGPRGALLFSKAEFAVRIDKTIFPGTSGGPHLHQIAATGQALLEVLGEDIYPDGRPFKEYSEAVVQNTQALEAGLIKGGLTITSPSQTHLSLVTLPNELDSLEVQERLESLGIITNRNQVPSDPKTAWRPSGLRLGTPALTSRGITSQQAHSLGELIANIIYKRIAAKDAAAEVSRLTEALHWHYRKP